MDAISRRKLLNRNSYWTSFVDMPENRELGGYTKVKENALGDTVVVKKDLLGRTVGETVVDPKDSLVQKADQTIKDVAHRLDTTNTVVLDKNIPKKTKGAFKIRSNPKLLCSDHFLAI